MLTISANLGFLWTELSLPDAIRAAGAAGFGAVECHMPYSFASAEVAAALADTGLSMVSLNTRIGFEGEVGVAALPGRQAEAREYIDEAIAYAAEVGCGAVSVVAGISGRTDEAEAVYQSNLAYAAAQADAHRITVLIEPLNTGVAEGYHLVSSDAGAETIDAVGAPNLKLMVDCFHASIMHDDLEAMFQRVISHVGHVQFASIPDRNEPIEGSVDYLRLLPWLAELGYGGAFGAEYTPKETTAEGIGWLDHFKELMS